MNLFFRFRFLPISHKMQSVDEFTPSTTEPVFGSGLISQTKNPSSTTNDTNDHEKSNSSSEPIVNGQNDTTVNKITSNENNITNGITENVNENSGAGDSSSVHVNGQNEKPSVAINDEAKPVEKSSQDEPIVPSTEPKPVSSTSDDTPMEVSSAVPTTTIDTAPPPTVEPITTATVNDDVPAVPVATESEPVEPKAKVNKEIFFEFFYLFILK
jgi:hypothetical protein